MQLGRQLRVRNYERRADKRPPSGRKKDVPLSERLQTDEALTLEKAKKLARQREAIKEQQSILKRDETNLDYIRGKGSTPKVSDRQLKASQTPGSKCMRCGKSQHSKQNCPAKDSTCYKCGNRAILEQYASIRQLHQSLRSHQR